MIVYNFILPSLIFTQILWKSNLDKPLIFINLSKNNFMAVDNVINVFNFS